jgi:hypothetical protein
VNTRYGSLWYCITDHMQEAEKDRVSEAIEALCTANGRDRGENGAIDADLMLMNILAKRNGQ